MYAPQVSGGSIQGRLAYTTHYWRGQALEDLLPRLGIG